MMRNNQVVTLRFSNINHRLIQNVSIHNGKLELVEALKDRAQEKI